jgi:hypothetical protein
VTDPGVTNFVLGLIAFVFLVVVAGETGRGGEL